jgi:glycosyltransferase involved in cell wall biosynthesis
VHASPVVSVVITCFNQEAFIAEAVESALTNVPSPAEVIAVDDGSTDESATILSGYDAVRTIRQENRGVWQARLTGIAAATGEFVVLLDGDDWLLRNGVEEGVALLRADPSCMLAAGHFQRVGATGEAIETPPPETLPDDPYKELLRRRDFGISAPSAVVFRRSVFDRIAPFAPTGGWTADYELYLRVAREFPICVHATPVAAYRRHPEGMSRRPEAMLLALGRALCSQRQFVTEREDLLRAYHEGHLHWLHYYGSRTLLELRADLHRLRLAPAARRVASLATVAPQYVRSRAWLRRHTGRG